LPLEKVDHLQTLNPWASTKWGVQMINEPADKGWTLPYVDWNSSITCIAATLCVYALNPDISMYMVVESWVWLTKLSKPLYVYICTKP